MQKAKNLIVVLVIIVSFTLFVSCNKNLNVEYEMIYLYSSLESGSLLLKVDDKNNLLEDSFAPDKKLIMGAFMDNLQVVDDAIYCASPLNYIGNQGSVSRININDLSITSIDTGLNATAFVVNDNIVYASSSTPEYSTITQTNIETGEILSTYNVPGSIYNLFIANKQLYCIANNYSIPNSSSIVYSISSQHSSLSKCFELTGSSYIEDVLVSEDFIFFASYNNTQDQDAFEIFKYNYLTNTTTKILLPFSKIHKLHMQDDKLYAIQFDYRKEQTQNSVAVIDIFTDEVLQVTSLPTTSMDSLILNNTLITSDGEYMYIYSLNDFKLEDSFKIPKPSDNNFNFIGFTITKLHKEIY